MLQNFYGSLCAGQTVHFLNSLRGKIHRRDLKAVTRKFTRVVAASGSQDDDSTGEQIPVLQEALKHWRRFPQIPAIRPLLIVGIPFFWLIDVHMAPYRKI